ncbi:MAG: hypothetical protein NXI30_14225 [bacterium]|nr:hypothetical protein [bacterium]
MSVHAEFGRALENLRAAVEMLPPDQASAHLEALAQARASAQPDLSSAARVALQALEDLDGVHGSGDRLSELAAHLDAHCRAILGLPRD